MGFSDELIGPYCGGWGEGALSLLGHVSISLIPSVIVFAAVCIVGGFFVYDARSFPSLTPPRALFFIVWILMYIAWGVCQFSVHWYEGGLCEVWLLNAIWLTGCGVFALWIPCLLLLKRKILVLFTMLLVTIWICGYCIAVIFIAPRVEVFVLLIIMLLVSIYMDIWALVFVRKAPKSYRPLTVKQLRMQVSAVVLGTKLERDSYDESQRDERIDDVIDFDNMQY